MQLLCLLIVLLFSSCGNKEQYTYAIKDFKRPLQPHLTNIVSKGIVMPENTALGNMATGKELLQLSMSEHPVLRSSAFREMLTREAFDDFKILMDHLDDTAMVLTDAGEFGTSYRTVSDDLLMEAEWKTGEDRNKTIDEVLTRHNYLRSAYTILQQIPAQEKYYPFIKDMATRRRNYNEDSGERGFEDVEYALYGLAKFKKKEDIKIIKERLLENNFRMDELSFHLMREFPDTAYLEVFEEYCRYRFYRSFGGTGIRPKH